jgi:P-type Ca2+ transporter type 2C
MNHMTITKMYTLESDEIIHVDRQIDHISNLGNDSALKRVLRIGNLCNNAHLGEFDKLVGQATDVALIDVLQKFQIEDIRPVLVLFSLLT